ncbi:MAG: tetratricopeptide repeat protein [Candidatus Zixiibacteriota bacterium]|nr:MAG: tetratricopeptide repeat protein [candidate division Zixibacteria bacterium]
MAKYCLIVLSFLIIAVPAASGAEGVQCRFSLYQYDDNNQQDVLLFEDSTVLVKDLVATGFIGPISVELEVKQIDTALVAFDVHVVTLGPPASTFSRSFSMEYNLPARMSGITCKNDSRYTLIITPQAPTEVDDHCLIDYRDSEAFTSMPSAFMDIYFMPSSLADYNWESVRSYLDFEYRRFQGVANFTLPGKIMVYLCPCPAYSIIWDRRFGMAVDPTRNNVFAIFSRSMNTADPFMVTYVSVLRNYGYSPPFLAEGLANLLAFTIYDAREIVREKTDFTLEPLLSTHGYLSCDPHVADRTASSFIKFLVGKYNISTFMDLYRAADDLNVKEKMEAVYALPFDSLEGQWKQWLDTVSIHPREYASAAGLAEQLFNYDLMVKRAENFLRSASSLQDSLEAIRLLRKAYFSRGDYYSADSLQGIFIDLDSTNALAWMTRGSYRMMNGYYEESLRDFQRASALDTLSQVIEFNLALNYLYRGDTSTARDILWNNISGGKGASAQGEIRIYLADIMLRSGDSTQRETAKTYLQEAVAMYQQSLSINRSLSTHYLWSGAALLGLDEVDAAIEYLNLADFLEIRPFYTGMINLWLGKAYDRMKQHDKAREHYSRVLSVASADYHQREARTHLEQQ